MAHAQRHTHSGDIEEQQQDSLTLLIWLMRRDTLTLETLKNNSKTNSTNMAHVQRHTHSGDIEEQQQDSNSTNMAHVQRHTHSGDIEEQQQDSNSSNMAHVQRHTHSGDIEEQQQDSLTLLIWLMDRDTLILETLKNNSKTL